MTKFNCEAAAFIVHRASGLYSFQDCGQLRVSISSTLCHRAFARSGALNRPILKSDQLIRPCSLSGNGSLSFNLEASGFVQVGCTRSALLYILCAPSKYNVGRWASSEDNPNDRRVLRGAYQ